MIRTAVITGASAGIGAETAARLHDLGWTLAIVGRNRERTDAVAAAVGGTAFYADFDALDDVRALAAALLAKYRRIDCLLYTSPSPRDRQKSRMPSSA